MFLTVHATAGIIIGQTTGNIWLAFFAGLISHFILDSIPHGDENLIGDDETAIKERWKMLLTIGLADGLVMLVMIFLLYQQKIIDLNGPVLAGIVGALFPDFLTIAFLLLKPRWLEKFLSFHNRIHSIFKKTVSFKTGLFIQLIFLIVFLSIIFKLG